MSGARSLASTPVAKHPWLNQRRQTLIESGSPEILEAEVKRCQLFLKNMQKLLEAHEHKDAKHWLTQVESLQQQQVDTPTIIGVVGNTGAGKSSVINAMLEEERLVPTNCMRACTAVVTEMSWNPSDDENTKYCADIEFIKASDWEKDLRVSLNELIDTNGEVSRECSNPESEAGIAYAKIKAVYPLKTKDMLASSTVEQLMNENGVKEILGTTKSITKRSSETFYRALQAYVDSKEKKDKKKDEKKVMEYWPLIKGKQVLFALLR
jgi:ribosome biogenesis GTPase A